MAIVNKFNVNREQVTLDADIIENMSANDVSYDYSTQYDENTVGDKLSELEEKTEEINRDVIETDDKSIVIEDNDGNKVGEINSTGADFKNLKSNGKEVITDISNKQDVIPDLDTIRNDVAKYSAAFEDEPTTSTVKEVVIGEDEDNPSVVIDENGVCVKDIKYLDGTSVGCNLPLQGLEMFTIGDSLSAGGVWQEEVTKLTGCKFDQEKNAKQGSELSQGGTTTNEPSLHSGLLRAFNLKANGYNPDIILLQNVNDQTCFTDTGSSKYETGTAMGKKAFVPSQIFDGGSYAQWENNAAGFLSSIATASRKLGTVIKFANVKSGKKIVVNNLPTSTGSVRVTINGVDANISVQPGNTKAEIVHKIFEYTYGGEVQKKENLTASDPYAEFSVADGTINVSFNDIDSTGLTLTITNNNVNTTVLEYFFGEDVAEWANVASWKSGVTPYQAWKGMIEFCLTNFPKAKLVLLMFPRFMFNKNLYVNSNGSINQDLYNETEIKEGDSAELIAEKKDRIKCRARIAMQNDVAKFYNLPIIDLNEGNGINVATYLSYYPNNNVHPNNEGYKYIGRMIANKLVTI